MLQLADRSLPLMPIDASFDTSGKLGAFIKPEATRGTWRAVGKVKSVGVLATSWVNSTPASYERMQMAGVIPLLTDTLRRELLDLMSRRDFQWTLKRHPQYATTDQELFRFPSMDARVSSLLTSRLIPGFSALYGVAPEQLHVHDHFLIKYEARAGMQSALPRHRDGSCFSFLIQLNPPSDFEGGGTLFAHAGAPISVPEGHALLFTGRYFHEGVNITGGVRYLLAGFVGYSSRGVDLDVINARLRLRDGMPCIETPARIGSHFNTQLLMRSSASTSGSQLLHKLVRPPDVEGSLTPHAERIFSEEPMRRLRWWCRLWLRIYGHSISNGTYGRVSMPEELAQMPLEVHAFLHHTVGWPLASALHKQPTARIGAKGNSSFSEDLRAVIFGR